ncbi:S-layer homology domain-containing protein [Pseudanabaena sp. FACHB-2040]|uniref:S-layer homology domain-containing protein n=1 Tax=Pseudanabaena sp. FACHB-2040 TaxID=2692859 RepID=UPI001682B0AC|nr:S-layer homology domain-containing protein [Pseudanabaena sp. FACHB-2040]MBD2258845.1 S-layer homology domain-containing protein [Pseudanabaena sp. FACHB-2040]
MVNLPPEPGETPSDRTRPTNSASAPLNFDEFIAVVVAFLALGGILLWGLTRPGLQTTGLFNLGDPGAAPLDDPTRPRVAPVPGDPADLEAERLRQDRVPETARPGVGSAPLEDPAATGGIFGPFLPTQRVPVATADSAIADPVPADPATTTPPPLDISDVPPDHWAYPFIARLFEAGYLPDFPEGQFQPDRALTRAELAALLNESLINPQTPGTPQTPGNPQFTDVAPDYWAAEAIQQAVAANYMRGFPEGDFRPDELVPRSQVLVSLTSGLGIPDSPYTQEILSRFPDSGELPDWARGKVAAAAAEGLVVNHPDPNLLRPEQPATRAEIVAMLYQALVERGDVERIDSPYVVPPLQQ